jgi:hypothetical protein
MLLQLKHIKRKRQRSFFDEARKEINCLEEEKLVAIW